MDGWMVGWFVVAGWLKTINFTTFNSICLFLMKITTTITTMTTTLSEW